MSKTKKSYNAIKTVAKAKFVAGGETLTIVVTEGKKGFGVHTSLDNGSDDKALTGNRSVSADRAVAMERFDALVADAAEKNSGWTEKMSTKNAYTGIPKPGSMAPRLVKPTAAKK